MSAERLNIGGGVSIPAGPNAAALMNFLGSGPDYRVHGQVIHGDAVVPKSAEMTTAPAQVHELAMTGAGVAAAAEYMPR